MESSRPEPPSLLQQTLPSNFHNDERMTTPCPVKFYQLLQKHNIVTQVKTGSTKELVTKVLIDHILGNNGSGCMAILVVNRIPLVAGHIRYFRRISRRKIKTLRFCGDLGLSHWRTKEWMRELECADVTVITAKGLLHALRHALIPLDKIKLLIFDECHLAVGDHPYSLIMQYYDDMRHLKRLPKVLGVTSGPEYLNRSIAWRSRDFVRSSWNKALDDLEFTFSAVCWTCWEDDSYNVDFVNWNPRLDLRLHFPYFSSRKLLRTFSKIRSNVKIQIVDARVFGSPLFYQYLEVKLPIFYTITQGDSNLLCKYIEENSGLSEAQDMKNSILNCRVTRRKHGFGEFSVDGPLSNQAVLLIVTPPSEYGISKKMYPFTSSRFLIFVRGQYLTRHFIRPINHSGGGVGASPLSSQHVMFSGYAKIFSGGQGVPHVRKEAAEMYSGGGSGVVVQGSTREEEKNTRSSGRFLFNQIQSTAPLARTRGRSFGASSQSADRSNRVKKVHGSWIKELADIGTGLAHFAAITKIRSNYSQQRGNCLSITSTKILLTSKTTRAMVPSSAAESLLAGYCELLPQGEEALSTVSSKPIYNVEEVPEGFICKVTLPPNAIVREGSCSAPETCSARSRATAALDAYRKLYDMKLIDEYLLPRWPWYLTGKETQEQQHSWEDHSSVDMRGGRGSRISGHLYQPSALVWEKGPSPSWTVFMYLVFPDIPKELSEEDLRKSSNHALLTRNKILEDDLHACALPSGVPLLKLEYAKSLSLTQSQYECAAEYFRRIQAVSANRPCELEQGHFCIEEPGYVFVPVELNGILPRNCDVSWDKVVALNSYQFNELTTWPGMLGEDEIQRLEHAIVQSRHDEKANIYYSTKLDRTLSPLSSRSVPPGVAYDNCRTYCDYFRERYQTDIKFKSQPMLCISARRVLLDSKKSNFHIVPELCRIVPLEKYTLFVAQQLPWWQRYMAVKEAYRSLGLARRGVSVTSFAQALTPRDSTGVTSQNYERLEFLGDVVVNYLTTLYTFHSKGVASEGVLSVSRNDLRTNDALCEIAVMNHLECAVAYTTSSMKLGRSRYILAPRRKKYNLSPSVLADVVEAVVGLVYSSRGLKTVASLLDDLGITQNLVTVMRNPFKQVCLEAVRDPRISDQRLKVVEDILGYCFNDKLLLVEALTHPSYVDACTESYERLEFLGDQVLGFVITDHIYKTYPEVSEATLTVVRQNAISNELFGRALIRLSLHKHIYYTSPAMEFDIKTFVDWECGKRNTDDQVPCPKVLGDVFESLAAAIVIDSKNDISNIWKLLGHVLLPLFDRFCDTDLLQHSVSRCVHMLNFLHKEPPIFRFRQLENANWDYEDSGESEDIKTLCEILSGEKILGRSVGRNKKLAKLHAAKRACQVLQPEYDQKKKVPTLVSAGLSNEYCKLYNVLTYVLRVLNSTTKVSTTLLNGSLVR